MLLLREAWGRKYRRKKKLIYILEIIWNCVNHLPYLFFLVYHLRKAKFAAEIGSGSGTQSFFVSLFVRTVDLVLVDYSIEVLKSSKVHRKQFHYVLCDAFRLPFRSESIDITYSEGVLEHYKPIEILQLLKEIIRISSKAFIFSCPMKGYPIFEDAIELNLYSLENWKKIMKIFQMQKRNFIIRIYLYFVLSPKIILYKLLKGKIGYDSIIIIIEKVK